MRKKGKYITELFQELSIDGDKLILEKEKQIIHILSVEPINFKLKSEQEQETILELYKSFMKRCNFDFQILIQTERVDMQKHIQEIEEYIEYEGEIKEIAESYIELIREMTGVRGGVSRKFYIVLKTKESEEFKIDKIIEGLKPMRQFCKNM